MDTTPITFQYGRLTTLNRLFTRLYADYCYNKYFLVQYLGERTLAFNVSNVLIWWISFSFSCLRILFMSYFGCSIWKVIQIQLWPFSVYVTGWLGVRALNLLTETLKDYVGGMPDKVLSMLKLAIGFGRFSLIQNLRSLIRSEMVKLPNGRAPGVFIVS